MVVGKHRLGKTSSWLQLRLRIAGAVLLAVSASIHLDLYLTGYRSIPTIGWLFLLQVVVGFGLAVAALVTRSWLAAAASAVFALSTLSAYLLAVWIGLFGFKEVRTRAGIAAGLIEVAAFAVLALAAIAAGPVRQADGPVSPDARLLARVQAVVSVVMPAVGAVSVAALTLLGVAVANASGPPAAAAGTMVTLKTAKVSGITVLTNTSGLTLYWFAPTPRRPPNAQGRVPPTGRRLPVIPKPGRASRASWAPSKGQAAVCRRPTTAILCTPISATTARAKRRATTSTSTAASGMRSACLGEARDPGRGVGRSRLAAGSSALKGTVSRPPPAAGSGCGQARLSRSSASGPRRGRRTGASRGARRTWRLAG